VEVQRRKQKVEVQGCDYHDSERTLLV